MATNKKEKLLLNTDPKGANNLTSRAIFMQRKLYDDVSYNNPILTKTTPINLREKILYGKTNTEAISLYLREEKLQQIQHSQETLFALDFVVDAFDDLKNEMDFLANREVTDPNSPYYSLVAKNAWQSIDNMYFQHMSLIYKKFVDYIYSFAQNKKIKDFKTFLEIFIKFVDEITPLVPLTRSKFIMSRDVGQNISGLVINLRDDDVTRDENKVQKYLNDSNFPIFKHSCEKFSFKVDKHVPWRIVFDIRSPVAERYYQRTSIPNLNKDNVIENYFIPAYNLDAQLLVQYLTQFYNSFVANNTIIVQPKVSILNGKVCVKSEKITRQMQDPEEIVEFFQPDFWYRLYAFVRGREENLNWNQEIFEKYVKNSYLLSLKDPEFSAKYLHKRINIQTSFSIKQRNFYFKTA